MKTATSTQSKIIIVTALAILLVVSFAFSACALKGRIMDDGEQDLVGALTAGVAQYNILIRESTTKLLNSVREKIGSERRHVIAFVGVDNRSSEELGDLREAIYTITNQVIQDSGFFTILSRDAVETVMRRSNLRPEDLVTQNGREAFLRELRPMGMEPSYLMTCKVTSASTAGASGRRQRDYLLTLGLTDVNTLVEFSESSRVRTEYRR
jgi:hypothetical protein